jgi:nickel-dependent lactate racemase
MLVDGLELDKSLECARALLDMNQMVTLPYGQQHLTLRTRNAKLFRPKSPRPVGNPRKYAQRKISTYFKENRGSFLQFKGKKACLVVSDNTRFALNHITVPLLLKELESVEIATRDILILVATGLHAPMSRSELIENLGEQIVVNFNIKNHDANAGLVSVGKTSRGTPLLLNRHFMESDLKIATGLVAPHFHAGFGGGYKSIVPGIAGELTILRNHSFNMLEHDNARYGCMDGNPVYEDIVEAGQKSGLHFIVNITVDPEMRLTHLFIGEPRVTHRKAAETVAKDMEVKFHGLFDVVVTTNGGYPLDRNLYQCVKGLAVAERMTKHGGTIILASECRDGVGHVTFQKYMAFGKDPNEVLQRLKADEPVPDQDNIQILARILTKARVIVVTRGVDATTIRAMKMEHAESIDQGLRSCGQSASERRSVAIVPGGPYVFPIEPGPTF